MKYGRTEFRIFNFGHPRTALLLIGLILIVAPLAIVQMAHAGSDNPREHVKQDEWRTGYWIWKMSERRFGSVGKGMEADLLYVEAGSVSRPGGRDPMRVSIEWPKHLPKASTYFALLRAEVKSVPPPDIIPEIVTGYQSLKKEASDAGQQLRGLQLDFDCPTEKLGEYARFMKQLREALPSDPQLSITALLDWFRPGTKIAEVLQWVDEYVPQFYDIGSPDAGDGNTGIAMAIEPSKWAPIFNSHARPYRIGIAAFGRIATVCIDQNKTGRMGRKFIREYDSLEMVRRKGLQLLSETRGSSGERVLRFKATAEAWRLADCSDPDEIIEMTIPTQESVLSAYKAAREFGGFCTGAIFFRWPSENEAMVLRPDEVRSIIEEGKLSLAQTTIEAEDGFCAAVSCVNLYLHRIGDRFPLDSLSFRIHSSVDLEYFLPRESLNARLAGRRTIEVTLPAYIGEPRVYLGRAVSREPAAYSLEGKK